MAWPKKGTRRIVVNREVWLWHYSGRRNDVVTVGRKGCPHYLFLDTFAWNFEHTPSHVAASIRWALAQKWSPLHGPDRGIFANDEGFQWLPEGQRHLTDRSSQIRFI